MSLLAAVKKANQPGPPEDSVRFRAAAAASVLVGIAACSAEGELAHPTALVSALLILSGMVFSYVTRARPPGYIKVAAAVAAVSLLAWFVNALSGGQITDITTVEDPLSVLFVGIQIVHSFHVPSRRDLIFTIAGAAGLIALAGAQAIELSFAYYAVPWLCFTLWALIELWRSASGGGLVSPRATAWPLGGVCAATLVVFLLLPAPTVAVRIGFISRAGNGGSIPDPGALAGDSGRPSQLSKPGTPAGRARVGGFLGFANHLNTALRGDLGKTLVMRVRTERPSYWIAQTYDRWDGENWISTVPPRQRLVDQSPFLIPLPIGDIAESQPDLQTFYLDASSPDLVFHADHAQEVWFPTRSLFVGADGTIVSPIGLGKGAVYTVESYVSDATPAELRAASGVARSDLYTQLPRPYTRAAALANTVTANATNTYDKVQALIGWIGAHTRYSTDIPPLPAGADTVDQFLFGTRVGFCEQISTSLAVMLRSLGIPAREAVGYVPGGYNPITDLYDVRAEDAHAWVQVWFPGYGWQSFDPTASVPLANPSPGGTALKDVGHALARIPVVPAGVGAGGIGAVLLALRWRRSLPATWDERVVREMERAGRRSHRPRHGSETLLEYADALDRLAGHRSPPLTGWRSLAADVTRAAYSPGRPSDVEQRRMTTEAQTLRRNMARHSRSASAEHGQSLVGLAVMLLVLGGIGAIVAVSVGGGPPRHLPSVGSTDTGPLASGRSSAAQGDIVAAAVVACNASYAAAEQAAAAYQVETGHLPSALSDLQPYLRDPLAERGFTISIQSGTLAVATAGHPSEAGPANCAFARA